MSIDRPPRVGTLLLAAALSACSAGGPSGRPALALVARTNVGEGVPWAGHARELAIDGDLVYLADSNDIPILRLGRGELELVHGVATERGAHCSSIALHAPSQTLVCTSADFGSIVELVDVRDPREPVIRRWMGTVPAGLRSIHDVAIDGDTLWLAADELGLLRATIGPDGTPGDVEVTGIGTELVQVARTADHLIVLDRVAGIVVLDRATLATIGSAPLDGPPLELTVESDRVVVSLGSEGVRVFHLDATGALALLASVQPRCVATAADIEGAQLAVACLSGLTLYDLRGATPRVAGFAPSRFGMLDVAFTEHGLMVVDWFEVDVFATDLDGTLAGPDAPRGMRLAPEADAHIPLRNPGDAPIRVSWTLRADGSSDVVAQGTIELPGSGEAVLVVARDTLLAAGSADRRAEVVFAAESHTPSRDDGLTTSTRLWHRDPSEEPARGIVGAGDPFPTLTRTVDSSAPPALPSHGAAGLVMFLTPDCFLQWPQLEDMAWSRAHGTGQPAPTIFVLTYMDFDPFDPAPSLVPFDAEALLAVEWADYHRSVPGTEDAPNGVASFDRTFSMMRLPGADFPHDYHLDASGTVTATSRVFRGRWPLGE